MTRHITEKPIPRLSLGITIAAVIISSGLWLAGLLSSPLINPENQSIYSYRRNTISSSNPEYLAEKKLAEAYWQRYPDVNLSEYWGPTGPLRIFGPHDHYKQYGQQEGRIFSVAQP